MYVWCINENNNKCVNFMWEWGCDTYCVFSDMTKQKASSFFYLNGPWNLSNIELIYMVMYDIAVKEGSKISTATYKMQGKLIDWNHILKEIVILMFDFATYSL